MLFISGFHLDTKINKWHEISNLNDNVIKAKPGSKRNNNYYIYY